MNKRYLNKQRNRQLHRFQIIDGRLFLDDFELKCITDFKVDYSYKELNAIRLRLLVEV